jgi:hypothetical protein
MQRRSGRKQSSPLRWSSETDRLLLEANAQGPEATRKAIDQILEEQRNNGQPGLTRRAVVNHLWELRIGEKRPGQHWSQERKDLATWMAGEHRAKEIAELLKCSETALRAMLWRERYSSRYSNGYALSQVCRDYGMGYRKVKRLVKANELTVKDGRILESSYLEFCQRQKEQDRLPKPGSVAEQLLEGIEEPNAGSSGKKRDAARAGGFYWSKD